MAKEHYYPIRDAEDPRKVILVPISEEVYRAIYPEIWRTRKRLQRCERCACPTSYSTWRCDGDCALCPYQAVGNQISIHTLIRDKPEYPIRDLTIEGTFADDAPSPEDVVMNRDLLSALHQKMEKLHPRCRRICQLIMEGKSKRESARIMGLNWTRYRKWYDKTMAALRADLIDYAYERMSVRGFINRKCFFYFPHEKKEPYRVG